MYSNCGHFPEQILYAARSNIDGGMPYFSSSKTVFIMIKVENVGRAYRIEVFKSIGMSISVQERILFLFSVISDVMKLEWKGTCFNLAE